MPHEIINCNALLKLLLFLNFMQDGLSSKIVRNGYKSDMILDTLWVIGLLRGPSTVTVGGKSVSFSYRADAHVSQLFLVTWLKVSNKM